MNRQKECGFCGDERELHMAVGLLAALMGDNHAIVCRRCMQSMEERTPAEWFRWLRRNDPAHWEKVVDHHRLRMGHIADQIRKIRIEI